jgi:hypothetical protein
LASTGSGRGPGRRAFLKAAAAGPLALAVPGSDAADYASAADVFAAVERLEAEVDARLAAVQAAAPGAAAFVASVDRDRARHRADRAEIGRRLRVRGGSPAPAPPRADASLDGLRLSQQALVFAHAEGLPALGDRGAVDRLAAHMVDLARQLAVIDLWIEMEEQRG